MSNINNIFNKKNVEYSLIEKNNVLPNPSVTLKVNQILFNPLNDAFNQLLNNDLYNQALLKQYIEEGNSAGPTLANSIEDVLNSVDDDKKFVVSGENGISVVHKTHIPVSETLSGRFLDGKRINRLKYIEDSFVALADDGFYASTDKIDWTELLQTNGIRFVDACFNYNALIGQDSRLSSFDWILLGNSSSGARLFGHNCSADYNKWEDFASVPYLSSFNFPNKVGTRIASFEDDPKFYICLSNNGMWSTTGKEGEEYSKENGTNSWTINDIAKLDLENKYEEYLLATNYGIKQSQEKNGFNNLKKIQSLGSDLLINDVLEVNGFIIVATSNGLAKISKTDESVSWIESLNNTTCYCIAHFNDSIYVGTSNGLFVLNSNEAIQVYQTPIVKSIVHDNHLFVSDGKQSLLYVDSRGFKIVKAVDAGLSPSDTIKQLVSHGKNLYLVTSDGIHSVKRGPITTEFVENGSNLSSKTVVFSKNISDTLVIVQDSTNAIYRVSGLESSSQIEEISPSQCPSEDDAGTTLFRITDVDEKDGNRLYLVGEDVYIYGIFPDNRCKKLPFKALDAKLVSISLNGNTVKGIAYVVADSGSEYKSVRFYNLDSKVSWKLNVSANDFNRIVQKDNVLFGSKNDSISLFGTTETISLKKEPSSYNVEDTNRTKYVRDYADYLEKPFYNAEYPIEIKASHMSAVVDGRRIEGISNLSAIDYIGYACESTTNKNFVIASTSSETNIYADNGIDSFDLTNTLAENSIEAFADVYSFNEDTANLSSGYNVYLKDNKLFYKSLESRFLKDSEFIDISKAAVIDDNVFFYVDIEDMQRLYYYDKLNGSQSLLSAKINNLLNIDGKLVACGNLENGIATYDSSDFSYREDTYFPKSIVQLFLSNEIVVEDGVSAAIGEGYSLSVEDFVPMQMRRNILSGSINEDNYLNLFIDPIHLICPDVRIKYVNLLYKTDDGSIVLEDISGNGYLVSVDLDTSRVHLSAIEDYTSIAYDTSILTNSFMCNGIEVSYDRNSGSKAYQLLSTSEDLEVIDGVSETVVSSIVSMMSGDEETIDIASLEYEVSSSLSDAYTIYDMFLSPSDFSVSANIESEDIDKIHAFLSFELSATITAYITSDTGVTLSTFDVVRQDMHELNREDDSSTHLSDIWDFSESIEGIKLGSYISIKTTLHLSALDDIDSGIDLTGSIDSNISLKNNKNKFFPILYQSSDYLKNTEVIYDNGNTDYAVDGYFFELSNGRYLGFTLGIGDQNASNVPLQAGFFTFSNIKSTTENISCGCAYIKNTDFSIEEEIESEDPDDPSITRTDYVLSSYKNDSFKDFFFYFLDGSDSIIYTPTLPSNNKVADHTDFDSFFKSQRPGNINCLKKRGSTMYVGTENGLLSSGANEFPTFHQCSYQQLSDSVTAMYSDSDNLYVKTESKAFRIDRTNSCTEISNFDNPFESNGKVYRVHNYKIEEFDVDGVPQVVDDFLGNVPLKCLGYAKEDNYYFSPILIGDDGIRYKKLVYDFSTPYSQLTSEVEDITDIKGVILNNQSFILYSTPHKIKYLNCSINMLQSSSAFNVLIDGLANIKTFGCSEDGNLAILDGTTFYCSENPIEMDSSNNIVRLDLSDFSYDFAVIDESIKVRFTQTDKFFKNEQPIGISEEDHYTLTNASTIRELTSTNILTASLYSFENNYLNGDLYAVGANNKKIYKLLNSINNQWDQIYSENSNARVYDPNNIVLKSIDEIWTIDYQLSIEPKKITNRGTNSEKYVMDAVPTGLFIFGNNVYYYSSNSSGIYEITDIMTYIQDEQHALSSELSNGVGLNTDSLAFLNDSDFLYSYSISGILPPSFDEDTDTILKASLFKSSNSELQDDLNNNYTTTVPITDIARIGRNIIATNGGSAIAYDTMLKTVKKIELDQLINMNGKSSIISLIKNQHGTHYIAYGGLLATFDGFGSIFFFGEPTDSYSILANNFRSGTNRIEIVKNPSDFLIGSNFGLKYVYDSFITKSFYNKVNRDESLNSTNISVIEKVNADNIYYIVAKNNELYEVTGLKTSRFAKLLSLDEDEMITSVFALQKNEYVIATTKGLYLTSNRYEVTNDLNVFTIDNVYSIINEELAKIIASHIEEDHDRRSFITELNKKADTKLSFISSSDRHEDKLKSSISNGLKLVENDIIDTIERGGESEDSNSFVKVAVRNWATMNISTEAFYSDDNFISKFTDPTSGKVFDISTVPYIVKNWKSGLKEIYIYVPTTATYYINNPQGISNSLYSYNSIGRQNVPGVSNTNILESCCTDLRVYLYNLYFGIKTIVAAQCIGNSLPLKIYKDNVNADDSWKGFFDTVVQPSVLRSLPKTSDESVNNVRVCTDDSERICLDFSIYGTDAQAIRIIAET